MTGESLKAVLCRLGRGDVAVAEQLHTAYAAYIRAIVRRRLSPNLRSHCDSADVAQSVWAQVVRRIESGWQVNTEPELRAMLAVIARRRLATRARSQVRRVKQSGTALTAVPARQQPTPSQIVHATDLWERMLQLCAPEHHDILRLRRDGLPLAVIAVRTGLHEGSVRRILRRLFRELALSEGDEQPHFDAGTDS